MNESQQEQLRQAADALMIKDWTETNGFIPGGFQLPLADKAAPVYRTRLYIATSYQNPMHGEAVQTLRRAGFYVYDFKNPCFPQKKTCWRDIDSKWEYWTPAEFRTAMDHPASVLDYQYNLTALQKCDACILLHTGGASSQGEFSYVAGERKPTAVLLKEGVRPDLMLKMASKLCLSMEEVLAWLHTTFKDRLHPTV